ncbi:MAG TPA: lamin tail domain-containing protein [Candidatus Limnocylindria bacterium]|nr:lamin tail domain-containing protein [Candidatus Limnocylindria bacterium]
MLLTLGARAERALSIILAGTLALSVFAGIAGNARAAIGDPYFSEYVEGPTGTFGKALEIYNPGNAPIDLGAGSYVVEAYANGATTPTTIPLTGFLASLDVFVIANPTSAAEILAVADQLSTAVNFNGDDALVLRAGGVVLDSIGQVGTDPGTNWGVAPTSTLDTVLRRKATVVTGDTNTADAYDPAIEWDGFLGTDFTDLGAYGSSEPGSGGGTVQADVTMAAAAACLELSDTSISFGTLGFGAEDQPAAPSVTLTNCATSSETLLASATDAVGSTATWSLVDSTETCADTLGLDNYRLGLHSQELPAPVSLSNLGKPIQTLSSGAATAHTAHIFTPCPGSSGDGQTLTFQINYLATE